MSCKHSPLSFIPPFLPDQTLYSWVAVFHERSGNASEDATIGQLFGSQKAGHQFHIPSHLDHFCGTTQLTLGNVAQIVATSTVLPAYLRFRPNEFASDVLQRVRGRNTAGVAQMLQIAQSRLYDFPPRRICRLCVEDDCADHGIAYWHRSHQLPGTLVCVRHETALHSTPMNSRDKRRRGFLTPAKDIHGTNLRGSRPKYPEYALPLLKRLAILSTQMCSQNLPGGYSKFAMRQSCIAALQARNLFSEDATECILQASRSYKEHFNVVAAIPELACALQQRSTRPLWCLLSNTQYPDHPLEYLLLIDWLFGNWGTFMQRYAAHQAPTA